METIVTKAAKAREIISFTLKKLGRIGVFCSFGKDSMVVLHLALQVDPNIPVIAVMTPFKPKETFDYMESMNNLWNLNLHVFQTDQKVEKELCVFNPDECCRINKEEPTKCALRDLDAWICGLRRTEGRTRTDFDTFEQTDRTFIGQDGLITKVNPILDWTETDIWKYMAINEIPVHEWYKQGYRSLGCSPCTHLVDDIDTERAGRWLGTSKCGGECGIHTMHKHPEIRP